MSSRRFRKRRHADDVATLRFDVTAQVRQRTAQADMIVNQQIIFPSFHASGESCRSRQSKLAIRPCMPDIVRLAQVIIRKREI